MHWPLLRLGDRSSFEIGKNSTEGDLRTVAECYISLNGIQGWGCGYDQIWNLNAPQAVQKGRRFHPPTPARQDAPLRMQGHSERRGEEVHTKLRLNRSLRSHASG